MPTALLSAVRAHAATWYCVTGSLAGCAAAAALLGAPAWLWLPTVALAAGTGGCTWRRVARLRAAVAESAPQPVTVCAVAGLLGTSRVTVSTPSGDVTFTSFPGTPRPAAAAVLHGRGDGPFVVVCGRDGYVPVGPRRRAALHHDTSVHLDRYRRGTGPSNRPDLDAFRAEADHR